MLVAHALGALRLPELQAFIDVNNAASGAVLRKAGLRDAGLATGPYLSVDRRFHLTREEWLAAAPLVTSTPRSPLPRASPARARDPRGRRGKRAGSSGA